MSAADRPDWATIPNLVTLVRLALLLPVCLRLADGPDEVHARAIAGAEFGKYRNAAR